MTATSTPRRRIRTVLRYLAVALIAAAAGVSLALSIGGANETSQDSLQQTQQTNAALCEFASAVDGGLLKIVGTRPTTPNGGLIVSSLQDIQRAAHRAVHSPACPPEGPR